MIPIEMIFSLLCIYRRAPGATVREARRALQRRGLAYARLDDLPRLSFWINLAQAAGLLDEARRPTLLVPDWFAMPSGEQLTSLFDAWVLAARSRDTRRARQQLPERLLNGQPPGQKEWDELPGLQALGLCEQANPTELGLAIWSGAGADIQAAEPLPWQLQANQLQVPYPPDWALLWELETFFDAFAPGQYALTRPSLRLAAQRGPAEVLIQVLETGLRAALPDQWATEIAGQPVLQVMEGCVLTFSQAEELALVRQNPSLRRHLDQLLSPQHVFLDGAHAWPALRHLQRVGLLAEINLPVVTQAGEAYFSESERAYLLTLAWFAAEMPALPPPPAGLLFKLADGLNLPLQAAAGRRAFAALSAISPRPNLPSESDAEAEIPPPPSAELLTWLEWAIPRQETLDVWYHVPHRPAAERRRITPLLIEQRNARFYLIAYCHHRRANRHFRLDRMRLVE